MAMTTMADIDRVVTVGIDTHSDVHVAAALDERGRKLGWQPFATTRAGLDQLEAWIHSLGTIDAIGIEGTGSWGATVARRLTARGHRIVEVDRPDRTTRRMEGKSDPIDAYAAARSVQAGTATGTPKTRTGTCESVRDLRVVRGSAVKARTQTINQIRSLIATAPEQLRDLTRSQLITRCVNLRPNLAELDNPTQAVKFALRSLARRHQQLTAEITELETHLGPLVTQAAPNLLALKGVGIDVAGQLLVTAGDNPTRIATEAQLAHLCGTAPIPASSGKTTRHRLNRGGDRQANAAIYRIVICRMRWDQRTRDYVQRRTTQGHTKPEIIRCLKRYITREIHRELTRLPLDHP
jgi:transposase